MVTASLGLIIGYWIVHTVLVASLQRFVPGSSYASIEDIGRYGVPMVRQFVIPLLIILALQLAFLRWSGWTRPVMVEELPRLRKRWWLVLLTFWMPVGILLREGWPSPKTDYLIALTVMALLVGITEELGYRGIVVHAARQVFGGDERRVVIVSSVLFGTMHLGNIALGAPVGSAIGQAVFTSVIGTFFYVYRRTSGLLVVPMVLHALWDWLLFVSKY